MHYSQLHGDWVNIRALLKYKGRHSWYTDWHHQDNGNYYTDKVAIFILRRPSDNENKCNILIWKKCGEKIIIIMRVYLFVSSVSICLVDNWSQYGVRHPGDTHPHRLSFLVDITQCKVWSVRITTLDTTSVVFLYLGLPCSCQMVKGIWHAVPVITWCQDFYWHRWRALCTGPGTHFSKGLWAHNWSLVEILCPLVIILMSTSDHSFAYVTHQLNLCLNKTWSYHHVWRNNKPNFHKNWNVRA